MRDAIEIHDLLVRTVIGVNEWERRVRQDVILNLWLSTDTRQPGQSDNLEDALNYRTVAKKMIELAESTEFFLIERLAEEIARLCIREFGVPRVRVTVEKPGALRFARSVGITMEREAADYLS